jgi:hypothetical protein
MSLAPGSCPTSATFVCHLRQAVASRAFLLTNQAWAARIRRMNSPKTGLRVASIVFALFALGHLLRLINHARVIVGTHHAPMWVSVVIIVIFGGLSIWMWRLSSKT